MPRDLGSKPSGGKNLLIFDFDAINDPRNVAFYRRDIQQQTQLQQQQQCQQQQKQQQQRQRDTPIPTPTVSAVTDSTVTAATSVTAAEVATAIATNLKTWATVASSAVAVQGTTTTTTLMKSVTRISPLFEREEKSVQRNGLLTAYDRIVVSPTHFNNGKFGGYITFEDSEVIRAAIGIQNEDFHGTTFDRSSSGELSITFRLSREVCGEKIKRELNSHFWFEKWSKDGILNKIRGCVIYPFPVGEFDNEEENVRPSKDIKEVKIEGSNYELKEKQILTWLQNYGSVESVLEEEAIQLGEGSETVLVGTGTYIVQVRLKRRIPNVLPMQGKRIRIWYHGVKYQCPACYGYHKNEQRCDKKLSFESYTTELKKNNPDLPNQMFSLEEEENYCNNKNEDIGEDGNFNGGGIDNNNNSNNNNNNNSNNNNNNNNNNDNINNDNERHEEGKLENEDEYSFLDTSQENIIEKVFFKQETQAEPDKKDEQDQQDEQDRQDEQDKFYTITGEIVYTNDDIHRLLDEPCNLSVEEKNWLMNQCCETEEEVFTKCRELLKRRANRKTI